MIAPEELEELRAICAGAKPLSDGPLELVHLPDLRFESDGNQVEVPEALLCLSAHHGYSTRLYLSQPILRKAKNWTVQTIAGRVWHSWSWQGVPHTHSPAQILAQHLKALR
jgi:hypothetical protein